MTVKEIYDAEQDNKGLVHLYRDRIFWKAYERSAYFFVTRICDFRPTKKFIKSVGDHVVSVGFPTAGTDKHSDKFTVVEQTALRLTVRPREKPTLEGYGLWKNSVAEKVQPPKPPVRTVTLSGSPPDGNDVIPGSTEGGTPPAPAVGPDSRMLNGAQTYSPEGHGQTGEGYIRHGRRQYDGTRAGIHGGPATGQAGYAADGCGPYRERAGLRQEPDLFAAAGDAPCPRASDHHGQGAYAPGAGEQAATARQAADADQIIYRYNMLMDIIKKIKNINIESKTPVECMLCLSEIKRMLADMGL